MRIALDLFAHPSRGGLAVVGAVGFWAANIAHPLGLLPGLRRAACRSAVVVQGFFLGMVANLFPFAPAGVGAVDAGMIGAFFLFGIPEDDGLRRRPDLPGGRLLAADPARDRRLLPAAQDGRTAGKQEGRPADDATSETPIAASPATVGAITSESEVAFLYKD